MAFSIGRYETRKELGRGGMAAVYLATDAVMERQVALKLMLPQFTADPQFIARFRREAKAVAQLEHRGITPVYDYGVYENRPYLVMRYMSGGSLGDLLTGRPLEPQRIAKLITELAAPLDFAHQKGIIHRDLKPDNILFDEYGIPYLSDFGIVKMIAGSAQTLTVTGGIVGTPAYMSPEQARGNVKLDGRSDVYALGVILFEMLSGKRPYKADTPMGLAMMHVLDPIPNIEEFLGTVPSQYQALINKAMAKNRDDRFQTAAELAAATNATLSGDRRAGSPLPVKPAAAAVASSKAATPGMPAVPNTPSQAGSGALNAPAAQAAVGQTAVLPAEATKRRIPLWMLAAAGIALIACIGIAAAAGAFVLGGNETPAMTATATRTATPSRTPTLSQSGAAGEQLTSTATPTPTGTPTVTRTATPTPTPVNTPTLKPLEPSPESTPVSSAATATPLPPAATPTFIPPTATRSAPQPPTNTPVPRTPTSTPPPVPPTATNTPPPTNTPVPPTSTPPPPPTNTPVPPTSTPPPPPTPATMPAADELPPATNTPSSDMSPS